MKTTTFFFLCFSFGIGLTHLSAQNGNNGDNNKSVKISRVFNYWQPVVCNGSEIDWLLGTTTLSGIQHFKDGVAIWEYFRNSGVVNSTVSTEEFRVKEVDKQYVVGNDNPYYVTWHFNLIGDQGSHYIGYMTWDLRINEMTVDKFVCVENGNK